MNMNVTIIIPVYNMEAYIRECLDSVLSQTMKVIEVICINDGSTDSSLSILQEYEKRDKRIKLIDQKNQGVAASRNRGIKEAKGTYVTFIDPDDRYPDNTVIETLWNCAEEKRVLIAGGEFSDFVDGQEPNAIFEDKKLYGYTYEKEGVMSYRDYQFDYGYHRFLYNREFLINKEIYFPPLIRFQDPPFFVKAMSEAGQFYACKKVTYQYRINYKEIIWNEERILAILTGLYDNLLIAIDKKYERLYQLTFSRIGEEYRERILAVYMQSIKVRKRMMDFLYLANDKERAVIEGMIDEAVGRLCEESAKRQQELHEKNEELCRVYGMLTEKSNELSRAYGKLDTKNDELCSVYAQIDAKNAEANKYKEQAEHVSNALSYRLGMGITFAPRMIRRAVYRLAGKH